MPQVLILDGNGIIHPRACGVACQLGVVTGIPSFGCAKKLLVFDGLDLDTIVASFDRADKRWADIRGDSGKLHGRAFKFDQASDPIFVSAGHKISLETCQIICDRTAISREPEAVNQSDLLGRDWLNKNYRHL
jgi:endonuclease V